VLGDHREEIDEQLPLVRLEALAEIGLRELFGPRLLDQPDADVRLRKTRFAVGGRAVLGTAGLARGGAV
jgi:hypothetical protein